jgi:hypothetical protein
MRSPRLVVAAVKGRWINDGGHFGAAAEVLDSARDELVHAIQSRSAKINDATVHGWELDQHPHMTR